MWLASPLWLAEPRQAGAGASYPGWLGWLAGGWLGWLACLFWLGFGWISAGFGLISAGFGLAWAGFDLISAWILHFRLLLLGFFNYL